MGLVHAAGVVLAGIEGTELNTDERFFLAKYQPSGLTLFGRNIPKPFVHVKELISEIKTFFPKGLPPPIFAIDQEGGRVARIRDQNFPEIGSMLKAFGDSAELDLSKLRRFAELQASALKDLGINLNFAPVCDVLLNEENSSIGDRCFSRDAFKVALAVREFVETYNKNGLASCAKHFPGQGDARADTHFEVASIEASISLLWVRELQPFLAAIHAEVPSIMVSHAWFLGIHEKSYVPASASSILLRRILRDQLGFKGLVISDDMQMKAIDQSDEKWAQALIASIRSGVDLLLVCRDVQRAAYAIEKISEEADKDSFFNLRLQEAYQAVLSFRQKWAF